MTVRDALTSSAPAVHRFVRRHRVLWVPAGWLSRLVASSRQSSAVGLVLGPLRNRLRGHMKAEDVVKVVRGLTEHDVGCYLAGGWGVDALVGRQTRSHDDLDVVIDDYDNEVGRAIEVLGTLGFRHVETHERRTWMPKRSVLDDGAGHRVELVSLNWQLLAREFGSPGADATARPEFQHLVFAEGTVGGQRVRCISAGVQLLYHTDFELEAAHRHDVALLHDELGASHRGRTPSLRPDHE